MSFKIDYGKLFDYDDFYWRHPTIILLNRLYLQPANGPRLCSREFDVRVKNFQNIEDSIENKNQLPTSFI